MKYSIKLLAIAALALGLSAATATALPLTIVDMTTTGSGKLALGVGTFHMNPSTVDLTALNNMVSVYNGASIAGYTKVAGANTPAVLSPATSLTPETTSSGNPVTIDLGAGGYLYLIALWDGWDSNGGEAVYYIGGLSGQISLQNDIFLNNQGNGYGLSGYWLANGGTSVPDGGATVGLLGLGLLGLAMIRRRFVHA